MPDVSPELDDDKALASVFSRQAQVSLLACQMAKLLYQARSIWIGGTLLTWEELTLGQRAQYRNEAERLIKARMVGVVNGTAKGDV